MKQIFSLPRFLSLLVAFAVTGTAGAQEPPPSAKELAGQLSNTIVDGSSIVRMKMEGGKPDPVLQLQIKSRRTASGSEVMYQILWPKERKGEGFIIRKTSSGTASGSYFKLPGTISPLAAGDMDQAVFGSDISYGDLVENFYAWDQQIVKGQETVDRIACVILESKPGGGDRSNYGLVRTWVDPKRLVPLRVEKFNKSGQMVRRITTTKVAKDDVRKYVAASLTVQQTGQTGTTTLEGSNISHEVGYQDIDFSPEALRTLSK